MKKTTTPFFFIVLLFFLVGSTSLVKSQNIVTNGDFESWTGGQPDGWTTIDPGITVTQETTIIHGGSSSASVDVTTATQGNTDFRQTVSVTGGISYDVSVWVYHTEGNMKARLYVAGYQGYSDNTITGAWQEMTYTYTYPADTNIEIGLRFYDQTGFDGNEIVYVDDYVISPASGGGNTQALYLEEFTSDLGTTTHYSVTGDNQVWEWANYGNPPGCSKMN
ncbi:MAG TPA: endonuclease I, partial [Bacteroidetes bacterium]|nr:endonuclease I [Bacteroidota bacterium]